MSVVPYEINSQKVRTIGTRKKLITHFVGNSMSDTCCVNVQQKSDRNYQRVTGRYSVFMQILFCCTVVRAFKIFAKFFVNTGHNSPSFCALSVKITIFLVREWWMGTETLAHRYLMMRRRTRVGAKTFDKARLVWHNLRSEQHPCYDWYLGVSI